MNFPKQNPNILFTSLASKYALYKEVLLNARLQFPDAQVTACDSDRQCAAASLVERFMEFPRLDTLSDEALIQICQKSKITHILPTRDSELLFWAKKKFLLSNYGISVWIGDPQFIKICGDKLTFSKNFQNAPIPAISSYDNPTDNISSKWVVKERHGAGSSNLLLNASADEARAAAERMNAPIFQPYVEGKELTAESWVSQKNLSPGVLLRWRDQVVNGESYQSTVFKNQKWEDLITEVFFHQEGARGHCLAQVIVDKGDDLHLVEINPRLGGASPLSLHAGLNSISWSLLEESGKEDEIPICPNFELGMRLIKNQGVVSFKSL